MEGFGLKMKRLKKKQAELEKELQEKNKEYEVHIISPSMQSGVDSLSQAMSHVSNKDREITGLKNQNKNLEDIATKT